MSEVYKRDEFESTLNNLGIIGQAKRVWLSVFRRDPRRATKGIFNKIVDIVGIPEPRPISEVIEEEDELIDKNSWDYIYKINGYRWGDAMYDWDLLN